MLLNHFIAPTSSFLVTLTTRLPQQGGEGATLLFTAIE